jgi:hypothetical protein
MGRTDTWGKNTFPQICPFPANPAGEFVRGLRTAWSPAPDELLQTGYGEIFRNLQPSQKCIRPSEPNGVCHKW